MEHAELRNLMVSNQLIPRGITDRRVLDAMRKIPRHIFVDNEFRHRAYDDMALKTGEGQTISQPYMVAIMTELLALEGKEKALEIGTGSGYQTAILAELSRSVFSIERHKSLSEQAAIRLETLGYANVRLKEGDGTLGWPEESPFDRILITAAAPEIPLTLMEQLAEGGIIVAPVGSIYSQVLRKIIKIGGKLIEESHTPCVFVPLIGKYGWPESDRA